MLLDRRENAIRLRLIQNQVDLTKETAALLTGVSASELRRLLTTLDPRLEILVEFRKVALRSLVPAERRAHQKGQRAREIFRLGQGRRSRVRLARFEAERVLADEETEQ